MPQPETTPAPSHESTTVGIRGVSVAAHSTSVSSMLRNAETRFISLARHLGEKEKKKTRAAPRSVVILNRGKVCADYRIVRCNCAIPGGPGFVPRPSTPRNYLELRDVAFPQWSESLEWKFREAIGRQEQTRESALSKGGSFQPVSCWSSPRLTELPILALLPEKYRVVQ